MCEHLHMEKKSREGLDTEGQNKAQERCKLPRKWSLNKSCRTVLSKL